MLNAGTAAPGFSLPNLQGGDPVIVVGLPGKAGRSSTSSPRGAVTAVPSWGRSATVARATTGRVAVVGVDSNDTSETAASPAAGRRHATYPVAVDAHATVATQYLIQALPVSYFLSSSGRVVGSALGPQTVASLDAWLARLGVDR